ncbi:MAG: glycosyl hydrolase-related protein [Oscillospiraceae bacterium]|jgi:alpha-mannosidase|nr:glycosyl hydrolase-related protein [Oscillospiraceae bacterium]
MKPTVYTVATAHLDTSWHWPLQKTIAEYLPRTFRDNFALLEKYPDYRFSFEGAYRYALLEEHYPELFAELPKYIAQGRWHCGGAAYENGDVNSPSPEGLLRNFMYGQRYFRQKFGVESNEAYLPDCFGFGPAFPSVCAHAGLNGFATQKLTWGSCADVPFPFGRWRGPDGKEIFVVTNGGTYVRVFTQEIRKLPTVKRRLSRAAKQCSFPAAYIFHGVGDQGGAPKEVSVKSVMDSLAKNSAEDVQVLSADGGQLFRDLAALPPAQQKRLPVYQGGWLLQSHGVGSYTARTWSKRWTKIGEQLADTAERLSSFALSLGLLPYPRRELELAWKQIIVHHFHDDITGTGNEENYLINWSDLQRACAGFYTIASNAAAALSAQLNGSFITGHPVAIANPAAFARTVTVSVPLPGGAGNSMIHGFTADGAAVPCGAAADGRNAVVSVPMEPLSVKLVDLRRFDSPFAGERDVSVSERTLENSFIRAVLDEDGDIVSIYDKIQNRETLRAPVRIALLDFQGSVIWPQWELDYPETMREPAAYAANPTFRIVENTPARVAIEVARTARGSAFRQVVSLAAGDDTLRVENEIHWSSPRTLCKIDIQGSAGSEKATFDLGLGVARYGTSSARRYEVPAQQWADLSDKAGGLSVLSDSRVGWDHPNKHTLRLTAVYTPRSNCRGNSGRLDFGLSRFAFGLRPHDAHWRLDTVKAAQSFCQPALALPLPKPPAGKAESLSFMQTSGDYAVRAVKRAEDTDEIVVRVTEMTGFPLAECGLRLGEGITAVRELNGIEDKLPAGETDYKSIVNGTLCFSLQPYAIRTFALRLAPAAPETVPFDPLSVPVSLPEEYDAARFPVANLLPPLNSRIAKQSPMHLRAAAEWLRNGVNALRVIRQSGT